MNPTDVALRRVLRTVHDRGGVTVAAAAALFADPDGLTALLGARADIETLEAAMVALIARVGPDAALAGLCRPAVPQPQPGRFWGMDDPQRDQLVETAFSLWTAQVGAGFHGPQGAREELERIALDLASRRESFEAGADPTRGLLRRRGEQVLAAAFP